MALARHWEHAMNDMTRGMGLVLATSVLLLAGCVTPGGYGSPGGYGGNPGGYGQPAPGYPSQYDSQLQGTVDGVDRGYNRIFVVVDDPRSGRAQRMEVGYDQSTRLTYQGREQSVEGLERGDVIRIDAAQSGRELLARSIEVVRNVRDGGYGNDLRGSVNFVDTRAQLIRLGGAGYGNDVQVGYDARTTVEYQGRSYRPENLQRGDLVRIQGRQLGNNQWLAERIIVERSVGR
jgi:hypothetical protein